MQKTLPENDSSIYHLHLQAAFHALISDDLKRTTRRCRSSTSHNSSASNLTPQHHAQAKEIIIKLTFSARNTSLACALHVSLFMQLHERPQAAPVLVLQGMKSAFSCLQNHAPYTYTYTRHSRLASQEKGCFERGGKGNAPRCCRERRAEERA